MTDPAPLSRLTEAFFDELVDGGLTPGQLREAVERLDREPDGWKRCALAFLEAQCWRESFRSIEDDLRALPGNATPVAEAQPASPGMSLAKWRPIALAAGIAAMAFSLGWWLHRDGRSPAVPEEASPIVAENRVPPTDVVRTGDHQDYAEVVTGRAGAEGPSPPITTVGRLRVGADEGSAAVPIIGGPGLDERWVANQPPPITEHQIALLERSGYQVDRQRRLITATLRDGRRLAVPIDRFQVRYTGNGPL